MEQALPLDENILSNLPGDHDFENGGVDELSAEEYLALVRREAERLPGVVRVAAPNSRPKSECMPRVDSIQNCPEGFLPDAAWVDDVCASFSDVRDVLARKSLDTSTRERKLVVPPMKSRRRWEIFCFGDDAGEQALEGAASLDEGEGNKYDEADSSRNADEPGEGGALEVRKVQLMEWLRSDGAPDDAIDGSSDDQEEEEEEEEEEEDKVEEEVGGTDVVEVEDGEVVESSSLASAPAAEPSNVTPSMQLMLQFDQVLTQRILGYHIEWLGATKHLTRPRCAWLYCLMARIEKPLSGDVASGMRQLYRVCCNARADLANRASAASLVAARDFDHAPGPVDLEESQEGELAMLNTIIAITGLYFGQGEEFAQLSET